MFYTLKSVLHYCVQFSQIRSHLLAFQVNYSVALQLKSTAVGLVRRLAGNGCLVLKMGMTCTYVHKMKSNPGVLLK